MLVNYRNDSCLTSFQKRSSLQVIGDTDRPVGVQHENPTSSTRFCSSWVLFRSEVPHWLLSPFGLPSFRPLQFLWLSVESSSLLRTSFLDHVLSRLLSLDDPENIRWSIPEVPSNYTKFQSSGPINLSVYPRSTYPLKIHIETLLRITPHYYLFLRPTPVLFLGCQVRRSILVGFPCRIQTS